MGAEIMRIARSATSAGTWSSGSPAKHEDEFVAADTGRGVPGAYRLQEPVRDLLQYVIACLVTQSVIHVLEIVQVDEQQRHFSARAPCRVKRDLQPVRRQAQLRQARELVVRRELLDPVALLVHFLQEIERRLLVSDDCLKDDERSHYRRDEQPDPRRHAGGVGSHVHRELERSGNDAKTDDSHQRRRGHGGDDAGTNRVECAYEQATQDQPPITGAQDAEGEQTGYADAPERQYQQGRLYGQRDCSAEAIYADDHQAEGDVQAVRKQPSGRR
jgi:hypothetical protein